MTRPCVAEDGYPPLPAGSGAAAAVEAVLAEAAESFAVDCDFDTYEPHKCNVLIAAHDVGSRLLDFESYHSLAALGSGTAPTPCPSCDDTGWYYPGYDRDAIPCGRPGCAAGQAVRDARAVGAGRVTPPDDEETPP